MELTVDQALQQAVAAHKEGKLQEAEQFYRAILQAQPNHPDANHNLGALAVAVGKPIESIPLFKLALDANPEIEQFWLSYIDALLKMKRFEEAKRVLAEGKRSGMPLDKLDAIKHRLKGGSSGAEPPPDQLNYLLEHYQAGRLEEAEELAKLLTQQFPKHPFGWKALGAVYQQTGRLGESLAAKQKSVELSPQDAEAHNNLGNTLQEQGRLDEADASLRQAIALKPDYAEAHRNLATTKKFSSEDEQFCQMHAFYRDPASSEKNRCHICFALAKASEDLEDYANAFQFYAEGNALRKKQLGYKKAQDKKLFERLKASYPRMAGHTFEPTIVATEPAPVFIVGMPRSGTTLVEQIISSHPLVTGAGELPFVSQFGSSLLVDQTPIDEEALTTFRGQYLNALKKRTEGKAIVTDKMPHNFRFLGLIARALPEAKIIHVKRDPAAVCWANYTQYFVSDSYGYCYDLDDVLHYHTLYQDLMDYWGEVLPGGIYILNYEALTEHQEEETRKLITQLGLAWDDACLSPQDNTRGVATTSAAQVRQTVYQGSSEKWKRYQPFLNGALDHLCVGKTPPF